MRQKKRPEDEQKRKQYDYTGPRNPVGLELSPGHERYFQQELCGLSPYRTHGLSRIDLQSKIVRNGARRRFAGAIFAQYEGRN
jgi:hypothetical protein